MTLVLLLLSKSNKVRNFFCFLPETSFQSWPRNIIAPEKERKGKFSLDIEENSAR